MKQEKSNETLQKGIVAVTILLGFVVYLGMPWARRYSIESFNPVPNVFLQTVVRPVFLFLLGYSFLWLMMRGAETPVLFGGKRAKSLQIISVGLFLIYQVYNAYVFFLSAPEWIQRLLVTLLQPYQNLVQRDSYLFVLLGLMFYLGSMRSPVEKEQGETPNVELVAEGETPPSL